MEEAFMSPKVADEYLINKRNFILECTGEILKEKPLYLVTMRDIIKRAGFSQGGIYRYYSGLDEIYIDFINKHTINNHLEQTIDALLNSAQSGKIILMECFIAMREYIAALLESAAGKPLFELLVLYASDFEKRITIFPKLKFKRSLEYVQNRIMDYTMRNVDKVVFRPQIQVRSIILFVSVFIDGISQSVVFNAAEGDQNDFASAANIPEMFQTLAKAVINFLGV
jgi:AcrR family transcriptional regulator